MNNEKKRIRLGSYHCLKQSLIGRVNKIKGEKILNGSRIECLEKVESEEQSKNCLKLLEHFHLNWIERSIFTQSEE